MNPEGMIILLCDQELSQCVEHGSLKKSRQRKVGKGAKGLKLLLTVSYVCGILLLAMLEIKAVLHFKGNA